MTVSMHYPKLVSMTKRTLLASLMCAGALFTLPGQAAPSAAAYAESYSPVGAASNQQAQIVFYRTQGGSDASHVYIDSEFQSALLPGGFTTFCVAPGNHTLGAYVKDAPMYSGKSAPGWQASLKAGETYFMMVSEGSSGMPVAKPRGEAEMELSSLRRQAHTLSRASAVEACQSAPAAEKQDYAISGDVLFKFGKSARKDLSYEGRRALEALAEKIMRENPQMERIEVVGHTDAIGNEAGNEALGARRAITVSRMLREYGIPGSVMTTRSAGSREPVVSDCGGSRAERVECMAPNRRVVISVSGQQNNAG